MPLFKHSLAKIFLFFTLISFPFFTLASSFNNFLQLNKSPTFAANFISFTSENGRDFQENERGKLFLKKPDKIRFETVSPNKQIIILNGTTITNDDLDLNEVTQSKLSATENSSLSFLLLKDDQKTLRSLFKISEISEKLPNNHINIFYLDSKKKDAEFKRLIFKFQNQKLSELIVLDSLGKYTKWCFFKVNLKEDLNDNLFTIHQASSRAEAKK